MNMNYVGCSIWRKKGVNLIEHLWRCLLRKTATEIRNLCENQEIESVGTKRVTENLKIELSVKILNQMI